MSLASVSCPEGDSDRSHLYITGRRSVALAAAASVSPSSGGVFSGEFLTDTSGEDNDELGDLLGQIQAFTQGLTYSEEDLFRFRELLLEAAQSVFLRWKVLHQLRTMALTDELTGLYNRRGFLLLGSHNLRLALRTQHPFLLFFADVDDLKQINDRCGHERGDALLVGCGEVLKMTFRKSDVIARIGGDEFVVLAQVNENESREAALSRLQTSIDLVNREVLAPYHLSLSIGVAAFDPLNPVTLTELLSIADREMMIAKVSRSLRSIGHQNDFSNEKVNGSF